MQASALPRRDFLRLFAFGDVASNFRRADDLAGPIFDGRDGQRDVDLRAISMDAYRFEMLDPITAFEPRKNFRLFVQTVWRDKHRDEPADGVLLLITK